MSLAGYEGLARYRQTAIYFVVCVSFLGLAVRVEGQQADIARLAESAAVVSAQLERVVGAAEEVQREA